jgi:hypothetical protein
MEKTENLLRCVPQVRVRAKKISARDHNNFGHRLDVQKRNRRARVIFISESVLALIS